MSYYFCAIVVLLLSLLVGVHLHLTQQTVTNFLFTKIALSAYTHFIRLKYGVSKDYEFNAVQNECIHPLLNISVSCEHIVLEQILKSAMRDKLDNNHQPGNLKEFRDNSLRYALWNYPPEPTISYQKVVFKIAEDDVLNALYIYPSHVKLSEFNALNNLDPKNHNKILIHLHGGGYIFGEPIQDINYLSKISFLNDVAIISLDYKLAPEYPLMHRHQINDVSYVVLDFLIKEKKFDPKQIYLFGESAGGGLTLIMLQYLRDNHNIILGGGMMISPWTDLAFKSESYESNYPFDVFVTKYILVQMKNYALRIYNSSGVIDEIGQEIKNSEEKYVMDPLISPLYGSFENLPPLFVWATKYEVMFDDASRVARKAKENGVEVTFIEGETNLHGIPQFCMFVPEQMKIIDQISKFLASH